MKLHLTDFTAIKQQTRQKATDINSIFVKKKIKNIENVKRCRDGMPKGMLTR